MKNNIGLEKAVTYAGLCGQEMALSKVAAPSRWLS